MLAWLITWRHPYSRILTSPHSYSSHRWRFWNSSCVLQERQRPPGIPRRRGFRPECSRRSRIPLKCYLKGLCGFSPSSSSRSRAPFNWVRRLFTRRTRAEVARALWPPGPAFGGEGGHLVKFAHDRRGSRWQTGCLSNAAAPDAPGRLKLAGRVYCCRPALPSRRV